MRRGWFFDSARHSLSRRGVSTGKNHQIKRHLLSVAVKPRPIEDFDRTRAGFYFIRPDQYLDLDPEWRSAVHTDSKRFKDIYNRMKKEGYRGRPIMVEFDENGVIVAGRHRAMAASMLGIEKIPIFVNRAGDKSLWQAYKKRYPTDQALGYGGSFESQLMKGDISGAFAYGDAERRSRLNSIVGIPKEYMSVDVGAY